MHPTYSQQESEDSSPDTKSAVSEHSSQSILSSCHSSSDMDRPVLAAVPPPPVTKEELLGISNEPIEQRYIRNKAILDAVHVARFFKTIDVSARSCSWGGRFRLCNEAECLKMIDEQNLKILTASTPFYGWEIREGEFSIASGYGLFTAVSSMANILKDTSLNIRVRKIECHVQSDLNADDLWFRSLL